jgi:hypothetical protein
MITVKNQNQVLTDTRIAWTAGKVIVLSADGAYIVWFGSGTLRRGIIGIALS